MTRTRLAAGHPFPKIEVPRHGGGTLTLGQAETAGNWRMVVVYRGKHCPICTRQLTELKEKLGDFNGQGVEVVAVSADSAERAEAQLGEIAPNFPVGYDLSVAQMEELGLYISDPRSPKESDRPFAEPGLFIVNDKGQLQIADTSNAPFARPSFDALLKGIAFVRDPANDYPIRGTHA